MTRSITRFTVEGCQHFDTAEQALEAACRMLYVTPEKKAGALEQLSQGKQVTLTYGFCSAHISPPRPTHPELPESVRAELGERP